MKTKLKTTLALLAAFCGLQLFTATTAWAAEAIDTVVYWNQDFANGSNKGGYKVSLGAGTTLNADGTVSLASDRNVNYYQGVVINFYDNQVATKYPGKNMTVIVKYSNLSLHNERSPLLSVIWGDNKDAGEIVFSAKDKNRMYYAAGVTASSASVSDTAIGSAGATIPTEGLMIVTMNGGSSSSNCYGTRIGFAAKNNDGTYGDFVDYGFNTNAKYSNKNFYGIKVGATIGPKNHFYRPAMKVEGVAIINGYTATFKTFKYLFPNESYRFDWQGSGSLSTTAATLANNLPLTAVTDAVFAGLMQSVDRTDSMTTACFKNFSPSESAPTSMTLQYQHLDPQHAKAADASVETSGNNLTIKKTGAHFNTDPTAKIGTDDTTWTGTSGNYTVNNLSVYAPYDKIATVTENKTWSAIWGDTPPTATDYFVGVFVKNNATITFDQAVTRDTLSFFGPGVTLAATTVPTIAKYDLRYCYPANVNFAVPSGSTVYAGLDTVIATSGQGALNVAAGMRATFVNGTTMGSYTTTAGSKYRWNNTTTATYTDEAAPRNSDNVIQSYNNATVSFAGDVTRKLLVEDGDNVTIKKRSANFSQVLMDVRGGKLTFDSSTRQFFNAPANGTMLTMTGGLAEYNGTNTTTDKDKYDKNLTFGWNERTLYVNISGGTLSVPNAYLQCWEGPTFNVTGTGKVKAKGIWRRNGQNTVTTFNVGNGGEVRVGAYGITSGNSDKMTFNLNAGGILSGYETGAFASHPLVLGGAATLVASNGVDFAVSGGISGSGSLTKAGAGTVTITGTISYTGTTTVSAGTLKLPADQLSGNVSLGAGTTLDITSSETKDSYSITSGTFTKGSGTLLLNDESYESAGYVLVGNKIVKPKKATVSETTTWAALWGENPPSETDAVELTVTADDATLTLGDDVTNAVLIVKSGVDNKLTLALGSGGNLTVTSGYNFINALGTVTLGFSTGSAPVTAGGDTVLRAGGTGTLTIGDGKTATIMDGQWGGSLSKTGLSTLRYAGTTTVTGNFPFKSGNSGTVIYAAPFATISDSTGLHFSGNLTRKFETGFSLTTTRFVLGDDSNAQQNFTQDGGTIIVNGQGDDTSTGSVPLLFAHYPSTVNYTMNGGVIDARSATTDGTTPARVMFGRDGHIYMTVGSDTDDAYFYAPGLWDGDRNNASTLTIGAKGHVILGSKGIDFADATTKTVALNGGVLGNYSDSTIIVPGGISVGADSVISNDFAMTISAPISGSGNLLKKGTGVLTLTGSASGFTGVLTVSAGGTVKVTDASWVTSGKLKFADTTASLILTDVVSGYGSATITVASDSAKPASVTIKNEADDTHVYTNVELTGEAPNFTVTYDPWLDGKGAWIDFTFSPDTLPEREAPSQTTITNGGTYSSFTLNYDSGYNQSNSYNRTTGALLVKSTPYNTITWPSTYTVAVYANVPNVEDCCLMAFGNGSGYLALLRGADDQHMRLAADTSTAQKYRNSVDMGAENAASQKHLIIFTNDGTEIKVYCDGDYVKSINAVTLGGAFQIGSLHGGVDNSGIKKVSDQTAEIKDAVELQMCRAYQSVLGPNAIAKLASDFPYVSPNGLSERTLATATENWNDAKWDVTIDGLKTPNQQPHAGSEIKLQASVASELTIDTTASYGKATISGDNAIVITGTTDKVSFTGAVKIKAPVRVGGCTLTYKPIDFSGVVVTIDDGDTLTYDFSTVDVNALTTQSRIKLIGDGDATLASSGKLVLVPPTGIKPYWVAQLEYDSGEHAWYAVFGPNHAPGSQVYAKAGTTDFTDATVVQTAEGVDTVMLQGDTLVITNAETGVTFNQTRSLLGGITINMANDAVISVKNATDGYAINGETVTVSGGKLRFVETAGNAKIGTSTIILDTNGNLDATGWVNVAGDMTISSGQNKTVFTNTGSNPLCLTGTGKIYKNGNGTVTFDCFLNDRNSASDVHDFQINGGTLVVKADATAHKLGAVTGGTLSIPAGATVAPTSITSTLTGAGTIDTANFADYPSTTTKPASLTGWTGKVIFKATDADVADLGARINAWGVAGSTVELRNVGTNTTSPGQGKGTWITGTINPKIVLAESNTVYLNNGSTSSTATITTLSGAGTLKLVWANVVKYAVTTMTNFTGQVNYTGTLTTGAGLTISTLALDATPAVNDKLVGTTTGSKLAITTITAGGTDITSQIVQEARTDGIYSSLTEADTKAKIGENRYPTVQAAIDVVEAPGSGKTLRDIVVSEGAEIPQGYKLQDGYLIKIDDQTAYIVETDKYYETLPDAYTAVQDGQTINLLKAATGTAAQTIDKSFTLNVGSLQLNLPHTINSGKTMTLIGDSTTAATVSGKFAVNGTLILRGKGNFTGVTGSGRSLQVNATGALVAQDGEWTSNSTGYAGAVTIAEGAKLTLNNSIQDPLDATHTLDVYGEYVLNKRYTANGASTYNFYAGATVSGTGDVYGALDMYSTSPTLHVLADPNGTHDTVTFTAPWRLRINNTVDIVEGVTLDAAGQVGYNTNNDSAADKKLIKTGAGTLKFSGSETKHVLGNIDIDAGTFVCNVQPFTNTDKTLKIASGATLDVSGWTGASITNLTLSTGSTLKPCAGGIYVGSSFASTGYHIDGSELLTDTSVTNTILTALSTPSIEGVTATGANGKAWDIRLNGNSIEAFYVERTEVHWSAEKGWVDKDDNPVTPGENSIIRLDDGNDITLTADVTAHSAYVAAGATAALTGQNYLNVGELDVPAGTTLEFKSDADIGAAEVIGAGTIKLNAGQISWENNRLTASKLTTFTGILQVTTGRMQRNTALTGGYTVQVVNGGQLYVKGGTWTVAIDASGNGWTGEVNEQARTPLRLEGGTLSGAFKAVGTTGSGYYSVMVTGNTTITNPSQWDVTGDVWLHNGNLQLGNNDGTGNATYTFGDSILVASGKTLTVKLHSGGSETGSPSPIINLGTEVKLNGGTIEMPDGSIGFAKINVLANSTITAQYNKGQVINYLTGAAETTLTFSGNGRTYYHIPILVVKDGNYTGKLVMTGSNGNYTADLYINGLAMANGTVELGDNAKLYVQTSATIGNLIGNSRNIGGNNNTVLTLKGGSAAGTITGGISLEIAGNVTLSGANNYTGTTTVSSGTLTIGSPNSLGTGTVTIAADATLDVGGNREVQVSALAGTGAIKYTVADSELVQDVKAKLLKPTDSGVPLTIPEGMTVTNGKTTFTPAIDDDGSLYVVPTEKYILGAVHATLTSGTTDFDNIAWLKEDGTTVPAGSDISHASAATITNVVDATLTMTDMTAPTTLGAKLVISGAGRVERTAAATENGAPTWTWQSGADGWTGTYALSGMNKSETNWNLTSYYNGTYSTFEFNGTLTGGHFRQESWTLGGLVLNGSVTFDNGYSKQSDNVTATQYSFTSLSGSGSLSTTTKNVSPVIRVGNADGFTGSINLGTGYRVIVGTGEIAITSAPKPANKTITFVGGTADLNANALTADSISVTNVTVKFHKADVTSSALNVQVGATLDFGAMSATNAWLSAGTTTFSSGTKIVLPECAAMAAGTYTVLGSGAGNTFSTDNITFRFNNETLSGFTTSVAGGVGKLTTPGWGMYWNRLTGNAEVPAGTYDQITLTGTIKATAFAEQGTLSNTQNPPEIGGSYASIIQSGTDTATHSVAGWFKVGDLASEKTLWFAKTTGGTIPSTSEHGGYRIAVTTDGRIKLAKAMYDGSGDSTDKDSGIQQTEANVVSAGTWCHIVMSITKDSGARTLSQVLYVNGVETAMSGTKKVKSNLVGQSCGSVIVGAGVTASAIYVSPVAIANAETAIGLATCKKYFSRTPFMVIIASSGDLNFSELDWAPAKPTDAQLVDGYDYQITNSANAKVTVDKALVANTFKVVSTAGTKVEFVPGTGIAASATSFDFVDALGTVTNRIATGTAPVTAGADTVLGVTGTGALTVGAGKKATLLAGVTMGSYVNNATGTIRRNGALGTMTDTVAFPGGDGIYEFESATIDGESSANKTVRVVDGDVVTLKKSANTDSRMRYKFDAVGGTLNLGNGNAAVWYGAGVNSTISGGTVNVLATGQALSGSGSGFLMGWSGSCTLDISGGLLNVANSSLNFWSANSGITMTGGGVKARGAFKGQNAGFVTVGSGATFEIGSFGWQSDAGTFTLNGGTLKALEDNAAFYGPIALPANSTVDVPADMLMTVSGVISGAGGITKTGAGTLKLLGANTFTGDITISEGILAASTNTLSTGTIRFGETGRLQVDMDDYALVVQTTGKVFNFEDGSDVTGKLIVLNADKYPWLSIGTSGVNLGKIVVGDLPFTGLHIVKMLPKTTSKTADRDPNGRDSGWIEVVNYGPDALDLANFKIVRSNLGKKVKTSDSDLSRLCSYTLQKGDTIRIYTSEEYPTAEDYGGAGTEVAWFKTKGGVVTKLDAYEDGAIMVVPTKVNPKKYPMVRLYDFTSGKAKAVDEIIVPSDLDDNMMVEVIASTNKLERRVAYTDGTKAEYGPEVNSLYGVKDVLGDLQLMKPDGFAAKDQPYAVVFPVNPFMTDGKVLASNEITRVDLEYRVFNENEAQMPVQTVQNLAKSLADTTELAATYGTNCCLYSGAIPASAFAAGGKLVQFRAKITDATGKVWTSPRNTNPDVGYAWYGVVVEPTLIDPVPSDNLQTTAVCTNRLQTFLMFVCGESKTQMDKDINDQERSKVPYGARIGIYDVANHTYYDNVRIDLRGQTSSTFKKKSHGLRFSKVAPLKCVDPFEGEEIESRKTSFIAEYGDPLYLRQTLALRVMRESGVKAPFDWPVRLYLNGTFYQIAFHSSRFSDEAVEDIYGLNKYGYSYKNVHQLTTDGGGAANGCEKKTPDDDNENKTGAYDVLNQYANRIQDETNPTTLTKIAMTNFNIAAWVNYMAAVKVTQEADDVWTNLGIYINKYDTFFNPNGDDTMMPLAYDQNLSWGQWYYGDDDKRGRIGIVSTNDTMKSHPFYGGKNVRYYKIKDQKTGEEEQFGGYNRGMEVILQNATFREMLVRRLRTLAEKYLGAPGAEKKDTPVWDWVVAYTNAISGDVAADHAKWNYTAQHMEENVSAIWVWNDAPSLDEAVDELWEDYIVPRRIHLYDYHAAKNAGKDGYPAADGACATGSSALIPESQPATETLGLRGALDFTDANGKKPGEDGFNLGVEGGIIGIVNTNNVAIDVSDWTVEGAVVATFKPGTVIPTNSVLWIVENRQAASKFLAERANGTDDPVVVNLDKTLVDKKGNRLEYFDAKSTDQLFLKDADGTPAITHEATIGTKYYITLLDAFNCAETNDIVALLTDIDNQTPAAVKTSVFLYGDTNTLTGAGFNVADGATLTIASGQIANGALAKSGSGNIVLIGGKYTEESKTAYTGIVSNQYHMAELGLPEGDYTYQVVPGEAAAEGEIILPVAQVDTSSVTNDTGVLSFTTNWLVTAGLAEVKDFKDEAGKKKVVDNLNARQTNHIQAWENAVLGLDGSVEANIPVILPKQTKDATKVTFKMADQDKVSTDSGAIVTYKVWMGSTPKGKDIGSSEAVLYTEDTAMPLPKDGVQYYMLEVITTPAK